MLGHADFANMESQGAGIAPMRARAHRREPVNRSSSDRSGRAWGSDCTGRLCPLGRHVGERLDGIREDCRHARGLTADIAMAVCPVIVSLHSL